MVKGDWPRCLLWTGNLVWNQRVLDLGLKHRFDIALGGYTCHILEHWDFAPGIARGNILGKLPRCPHVWSDGSLVADWVSVLLRLGRTCLPMYLCRHGAIVNEVGAS